MPARLPKSGRSSRPARSVGVVFGIAVLALGVFAFDLSGEPPFVDESAYISQTYFAELWIRGATNDPAWLSYPAYDLPPLPKYLIGAALMLTGHRTPGPATAQAWYRNTSLRFVTTEALTAARVPSVVLGALGCVALYGLGRLASGDGRVGGLAALLLMVNPLYRLHARRAMSDVPAEAFLLVALAVALWGGRRALAGRSGPAFWGALVVAGVCGGLATLSKLNGALALVIILIWGGLALGLPGVAQGRKLSVMIGAVVAGAVAVATFVALNPFLTARPARPADPQTATLAGMSMVRRAKVLVDQRLAVARGQQVLFAHNALTTPVRKLEAVVVQGFGRFGPFGPRHSDSTKRFDWSQDAGAVVWLPWVLAGAVWAFRRGRAQRAAGEPPTARAVLAQALVTLMVVTAYLPLAWDRYYLSLQPVAALLGAGAAVAARDGLAGRLRSKRKGA